MAKVPHRPWHEPWWEPDDEYSAPFSADPPSIEVEVEDRCEVAVILGPDGEPISTLLDRPEVPFGFTTGDRTPTRWRRL